MNSRFWMILALVAAIAAVACDSRRADDALEALSASASTAGAATNAPETRHVDAPSGIAWRDDLEAAFGEARANGKPVFLFWGAVWCPYCADLKAHVFARRDIQEKLKLFVPIYLDGDDSGAQKWGDEFEVTGYPTVLALDSQREELARIAGGMEVAVYAEMLDLVLRDVRPVSTLLDSLDNGSVALSADDCRRLAYNGWGLSDDEGADLAAPLARAVERCPADARLERARLTAIAAAYAVDTEIHSIELGEALSAELATQIDAVHAILADRELAVAAADALLYLGADFFTAARALDAVAAAELVEDWSTVMDAAAGDTRYTEGDRLLAIRSKIVATKSLREGGGVPPEVDAAARALAHAALERARGTPAEPGAVNATVNLLVALDDPAAAYAVAEAAVSVSKTPYYHMADLAALDERMGRTDSAIEWLERAYGESQGPATRFQWGTNYVRGLIRMRPDDEATVRDAALAVLGELDGPSRIYRRSRTRLDTLGQDLRVWNEDGAHEDAVAAIRARMDAICAQISATEEEALSACRSFLAADSG